MNGCVCFDTPGAVICIFTNLASGDFFYKTEFLQRFYPTRILVLT